jgi:hypothetical protein
MVHHYAKQIGTAVFQRCWFKSCWGKNSKWQQYNVTTRFDPEGFLAVLNILYINVQTFYPSVTVGFLTDKFLFFPQQDLNQHRWNTAVPICLVTVRNGNSISVDVTEDTIWHVLDFLSLQDKHNIHTLSINIKLIYTRCVTVQKSLPKDMFFYRSYTVCIAIN